MPRARKPPPATDGIDELLEAVRARHDRLGPSTCDRAAFLDHLRSLADWGEGRPDYPRRPTPRFPEFIDVAYATCNRRCGVRELIVDGSTQECQRCGGSMFRWSSVEYRRAARPRRERTRRAARSLVRRR